MKILALCLAMIEDETDKQKFETMYWKYRNLLFHCAKKRLSDNQLAEDAVSIAFIHAAENLNMFDEAVSKNTKYLLITMVDRTAINIYKKQQRIYNRTIPMDEVEYMVWEPELDEIYSVAEAIQKLPESYQQVIILRYSEGYTNRDIASILGYSVAKVDQMMSRARKMLASFLEEV